MNGDLPALCARLGLATLNGLYQGLFISLLVAAVLRFSLRTNATTRHAVWFGSLWLVAVIIPAHFWLDRPSPSSALVDNPVRSSRSAGFSPASGTSSWTPFAFVEPWQFSTIPDSSPASASPLAPEPLPVPPLSTEHPIEGPLVPSRSAWRHRSGAELSTYLVPPSDSAGVLAEAGPRTLHTHVSKAFGFDRMADPLARVMEGAKRATQLFLQPLSWTVESAPAFPLLATLLLLWLCISGIRLVMLAVRLRQIRQFAEGSAPPCKELLDRFHRLRREGGVRRGADLRVSADQRCPLVLGFFHPVVLLPADIAAQADGAEVDHVLRHELAHVRRYDDWANLAQHFVQALLFFHPSVWWINRRLSLEREIACDDHVLDQGGSRRNYALILTTVASRLSQKTPMLAPGVSNSTNQLQQRINMILNTRRNASPSLATGWSASIISAAAVLAVLALYSGPRLVLAETPVASNSTVTATPKAPSSEVEWDGTSSSSVAVVTSIEAPVQVSVDVDAGPKFKPELPGVDAPNDNQMEPPEPPEMLGMPTPPKPARAPRVARPGKPPKTPRAPEPAANREDSGIEDRLRRLEKMMGELMEQQGLKRSHGTYVFKDGADMKFNFNQEQMEKQMEKQKQASDRQAARAAEQAQRAVEQAKRATKEIEARLEQDQSGKGEFRESLERQLESLRKAREGLGQEMERLGRQIEKLEREQQRSNKNVDKDPERHSDATPGNLGGQVSVTPELAE